jgi:hypothetical protein
VYDLDHNYFANPPAWQDFVTGLDRLAQLGSARRRCVLLLQHTLLHYLNRFHPLRRHYDAVAGAATQRGIFVQPTLPAFLGRDPRPLWVSPVDPHPNATAHRLLADALLEGLLGLPPRCGLPRTALSGPMPARARRAAR